MTESASCGRDVDGGLQQKFQASRFRKGVDEMTRRGGASPPLPCWTFYENPFYEGLAAAVVAAAEAAAVAAMEVEKQDSIETEDEEDKTIEVHQVGAEAPTCTVMAHRSSAPSVRRAAMDRGSEAQQETSIAMSAGSRLDTSGASAAAGAPTKGSSHATRRRAHVRAGFRAQSPAIAGAFDKEAWAGKDPPTMAEPSHEETPPAMMPRAREQSPLSCSPCSHLQPRAPSSTSESPASAQPTKASKVSIRSPQLNKSPQPTSSISPPLKTITLMRPKAGGDAARLRNSSSKSASSSQCSPLGIDAVDQLVTPIDNYHLADAGVITSPRDYLKTLNRARVLEEKRMDSSPIISALSEELKRALTRVQELERSQISARREIDGLLKRFAEERAMLRSREQEKIQAAVMPIEDELDKERKGRRKLEAENRRLNRNLGEASKAVVKAEKELDKERKARQLMEDVCDELAREIGEDKAEVEELKREHAKAREDMEEERRTLLMTEAWREERVQMKLSEAKFELEERCVALDKLKMELELFLNSWQTQGIEGFQMRKGEDLRDATEKAKAETSWSMLTLENSTSYAPLSQEDGGLSSDDVRSLRLSRDNIRGHSEWGAYPNEYARERAKWVMDSTEYDGEHSGRLLNSKEDSGAIMIMSDVNAYSDRHDSAWNKRAPLSRRGRNETSRAAYARRQNGLGYFEDSDPGEDRMKEEENGDEGGSDDVGSQWGYVCEGGYGNQDEEGKWTPDGSEGNGQSRQEGDTSESAERGSESNSSRESIRRVFRLQKEQGQGGARLKLSQNGNGEGRAHHNAGVTFLSSTRENAFLSDARHGGLNTEEESESFSFAGASPVYKHRLGSPDVMAQKQNWPVVPAYRSASQGRRTLVESSAPRRRSAEWTKPNSLQADLISRQLKGPRFKG